MKNLCIQNEYIPSMKQQLYGHLPPISKFIQVGQTRHAGHYWRNKDKLITNIHLWTPTHGHASVGQLAKIYLHQLCVDTGYSLENLMGAKDDGDGWRERSSGKSMLAGWFDGDDNLCIKEKLEYFHNPWIKIWSKLFSLNNT